MKAVHVEFKVLHMQVIASGHKGIIRFLADIVHICKIVFKSSGDRDVVNLINHPLSASFQKKSA